MPQTFFKNLLQSHGKRVTVEYQMEKERCASIVAKWPNTREYRRLTAERSNLETHSFERGDAIDEKLCELDGLIAVLEDRCLSDEEMQRVEAWLSEYHIQTSDIEF